MLPKVSIVISVRNEEKYIADLLDSIASLDYPKEKLETIIVDGGSTDKTIDIISRYPFVKLFNFHCNYSEGKNFGVKEATGEIIAFLDGDCIADEDWLRNIVKHFQKNPEIVGLGGPYIFSNQKELFAKYRAHFFYSVWFPKKTELIVRPGTFGGGNSAYKKEIFEKIGYFNPLLGRGAAINSGEDVDFNLKILNSGRKLLYAKDVRVFHKYGTNFKKGCKQAFKDGRDSSLYSAKFGRKGVMTNLRNIFLPISFLTLVFLICLSLLLGLFLPLYLISLLFFCYYLYKLIRFYLRDEIGVGRVARILAPFFDISLMLFWAMGSLVGLIKKQR
jgi:cellulose synthase/poly-beta-1,6-N-acetylglucosamine synthase-like glycosyltransferase